MGHVIVPAAKAAVLAGGHDRLHRRIVGIDRSFAGQHLHELPPRLQHPFPFEEPPDEKITFLGHPLTQSRHV